MVSMIPAYLAGKKESVILTDEMPLNSYIFCGNTMKKGRSHPVEVFLITSHILLVNLEDFTELIIFRVI